MLAGKARQMAKLACKSKPVVERHLLDGEILGEIRPC